MRSLVRQAQLGASYRVQVLIRQGQTSHLYRVLRLWKSSELYACFYRSCKHAK